MFAYLSLGLGASTVLAGGFAFYLNSQIDKVESQLQVKSIQLNSCAARLQNILEDRESDNEIDNIPDLRDFVVPGHWLLLVPTDSDS